MFSTQAKKLADQQIDLTDCDKEPIHIPGSIQTHGFLLAVQEPALTIAQLSDNVSYFLKCPPNSLIGSNLQKVIGNDYYGYLKEHLGLYGSLKELNPLNITIMIKSQPHLFDLSLHRSGGLLILEFEPSIPRLENHAQQFYKQSQSAIRRLKTVANLNELYNSVVHEVKQLTGYDRVMLYQFFEKHGQVVAEAREPALESYQGLHYPASDIPVQARTLFLKNGLRIITDIDYRPALLIPADNPITDLPLDLSLAILHSVSPIHIQYLRNMGVKASLTISIVIENKLWGLITCHHLQPKFVAYETRAACELLGQVVVWQIATLQATMLSKQLIDQQQLLNSIYDDFKENNPWYTSVIAQADSLMKLANAQGIAICYEGKYASFGMVPVAKEVIKLSSKVTTLTTERVYENACISTIFNDAVNYSHLAAGIMISLLSPGDGDFIIWFRPEIIHTIQWGGNPHKSVTIESGSARLTPCQSFAVGQKEVKYQARPWAPAEIEAVKQLTRFLIEMKLKHYYQAARDIQTNKTKFAEEMRQKQQTFIDRICHEIRNPINGILGSLALVRNKLENMQNAIKQAPSSEEKFKATLISQFDELQGDLDNIDECAKHQTVITNDVLSLAKLKQNKMAANNYPYELVQTIQTVINMFIPIINKKGLHFEVTLPETAVWLKSDAKITKQILVNILGNAVKFTSKGHIKLTLIKHAEIANQVEYHIQIEDTGIGITPEQKTRLFQTFEQTNPNISDTYGGSGLGLSISLELARLLKGSIDVKSQFDEGSTFTLVMQVEKLSLEEVAIISKRKSTDEIRALSIPHQPLKHPILIVEDNAINQKILVSMLTKEGYVCEVAENGQMAVDKYRTSPYALVFMDIQMPIMNGYDATKQIREIEQSNQLSAVYIICLSANVSEEHKLQALQAGMDDYITKPYIKEEILDALGQFHNYSKLDHSSNLSSSSASESNSLSHNTFFANQSAVKKEETLALSSIEITTDSSTFNLKKRKKASDFWENDNNESLEESSSVNFNKSDI